MHRVFKHLVTELLAITLFTAGFAGTTALAADDGNGAVFTATNASSGNAVLAFHRADDGTLTAAGTYPTGGLGSGVGLGSQGAVTLSEDGRWLFVVDAGSNDIATFAVRDAGLTLVGRTASGGTNPISVTAAGNLVYALNAGSPNVSGFTVAGDGTLTPIAGSTRSLAGSGAAQVSFTTSGRALAVTMKASNTISTLAVDEDGVAGTPHSYASSGGTPFGFGVGRHDEIVVTEAAGAPAGLSAASSYRVSRDGTLTLVSASVPTTQKAACWGLVTKNGHFAYTANAASDSLSLFTIDRDSAIALAQPQAAYVAGTHPLDLAASENGRFLYVLESFTHTIGAYRIASDGSLTRVGGATNVLMGAGGLAAR